MKILVLGKRFTSGRDSVKDNFGRVLRLFEQVAKNKEVTVIAADHIKKENFETRINGMKIEVVPFSMMKILGYYLRVKNEAVSGRYDLIYATSHPVFAAVALLISKLHKIPMAYDLQDNYKVYTRNPILLFISDKAMQNSKLVSCASYKLAEMARPHSENTVVIPNGYDPRIVKYSNKKNARAKLKLPANARLISYTGSTGYRSIELLLEGFKKLSRKHGDMRLLLVGDEIKRKLRNVNDKRIIILESMPYEKLFVAINAADVMVLPYQKNIFTEVLLAPYKLVEYMACKKPIVISDAGEMQKLVPKFVFRTDDIEDMNRKIEEALKYESIDYSKQLKNLTWKALGEKLAKAISSG